MVPNKHANINRLDTYFFTHNKYGWLSLQRLSKINGKVNLQEADLLENGCCQYAFKNRSWT